MNGIKKSGRGNKKLVYCTIRLKGGQKLDKAIVLLEKNLIKHAFTEGHELLNIQGAKIQYHEIGFKGSLTTLDLFGRCILVPLT